MNILILGSGGREHALAWKLKQSPELTGLYVLPGNAGTAAIARNIPGVVNDFGAIRETVLARKITMVIVGPEEPLVKGIHDFFLGDPELRDIPVIGPRKKAAALEGSKQFGKEFMVRHGIPTAAYRSFTSASLKDGLDFLDTLKPPFVLKADGLAAGKGVLILHDRSQARSELKAMLVDAKFGEASATVVIEEFLTGIEVSIFVLTEGANFKMLPMAKDYKRIGIGDTGLNTGGMGAVSPVPFADNDFVEKVRTRIVEPTIKGLKSDNIPYSGFLFIGLIKVGGEPWVIEYNVRLGDPEAEVVLPRIKNDLLPLLRAVPEQSLDTQELQVDERATGAVMAVSGGYPQAYIKGKRIEGLKDIGDALAFHAGTAFKNNEVVTNGGRVIALTAYGSDIKAALARAYANMDWIQFEGMYYRTDIGSDL